MRQLGRGSVFVNLNAVGFQGGEQGIQLFGGMFFPREHVIYFIRKQIAALLAHTEQVAELIIFFLGHEHEGFSPSSYCRNWPPNWPDAGETQTGKCTRAQGAAWTTLDRIQPWLVPRAETQCSLEYDFYCITTLLLPNAGPANESKKFVEISGFGGSGRPKWKRPRRKAPQPLPDSNFMLPTAPEALLREVKSGWIWSWKLDLRDARCWYGRLSEPQAWLNG